MMPLILAAIAAAVGFSIARGTRVNTVASGGVVQQRPSAIATLQAMIARRMPVPPGLALAAWREAVARRDVVTAQQIALVFFPPPVPPQQPQQEPPIVIGEDETAALQETYADAEPAKATTTTIMHNQPQPQAAPVQDVSPEEWGEFLLSFKTKDVGYKGERHIGAFEHSARRLAQLGIDASALTTEEAQRMALDKDLNNYLQTCERLLNEFTGETVSVNGEKVPVTRSGVLSLLKAAGPAGAKGWLTEEHQRKAFPHTTEMFLRGNGRF